MLLSPLASTMFVVKRTKTSSNTKATLTQQLGFVDGWQDVLPAYSAANLASSIFLSNGSMPPYITENWAFPSFDTIGSIAEGVSSPTITADLPGILTSANCEDTNITFSSNTGNTYYLWNAQITGKKTGVSWSQLLPYVITSHVLPFKADQLMIHHMQWLWLYTVVS